MSRIGKTFEQELSNNILDDIQGGAATITTTSVSCMVGSAIISGAITIVSLVFTKYMFYNEKGLCVCHLFIY